MGCSWKTLFLPAFLFKVRPQELKRSQSRGCLLSCWVSGFILVSWDAEGKGYLLLPSLQVLEG